MIALVICVAAMLACYVAGRRSLAQGLVVLLAFGYFYGILRANLPSTLGHFIFDAGLLGLYASFRWTAPSNPFNGERRVQLWLLLLTVWPLLLVFLPFQPLLVTLVGLRGNVYFLPILIMGSRLKGKDITTLAVGLALLDLVAVAFGGAEYFMGVERFFPRNAVTEIMYDSRDVAGGFLRIPATFANAHAFGGMMVSTLPFLVGLWTEAEKRLVRILGFISVPVALMGVLMSATRLNFVTGCAMVLFVIMRSQMKARQRAVFLVIVGVVGVVAVSNARFQRFKSLDDTDYVSERIAGSVNRGFWEILVDYPMGNGLGGGGTSLPYFLEAQVRNPIALENEYARILAEQGIIGLSLWLGFLGWFIHRGKAAFANGRWSTTRRLTWCLTAFGFSTAWIGTGILTSIPGTALLMLGMGWTAMKPSEEPAAPLRGPVRLRVPARGKPRVPAFS
jgi:O-Antigen ligase